MRPELILTLALTDLGVVNASLYEDISNPEATNIVLVLRGGNNVYLRIPSANLDDVPWCLDYCRSAVESHLAATEMQLRAQEAQ